MGDRKIFRTKRSYRDRGSSTEYTRGARRADSRSPPACLRAVLGKMEIEDGGRHKSSSRNLYVDIRVDSDSKTVLLSFAIDCKHWSGRGDLNARPPAPKTDSGLIPRPPIFIDL